MKFSGRPIRYNRTLDMFGKAIALLQIPYGLGKSLPSFFVVCGFRTGLVSPVVNQNWQEFVPFFCFPSLGFKVIWFPTVFPPNPSIDAFFLVFLHDHTIYSFKRKTRPKTSAENLRKRRISSRHSTPTRKPRITCRNLRKTRKMRFRSFGQLGGSFRSSGSSNLRNNLRS